MYKFHHIECKNKFPVRKNISGDDIRISDFKFPISKKEDICLNDFLSYLTIQNTYLYFCLDQQLASNISHSDIVSFAISFSIIATYFFSH